MEGDGSSPYLSRPTSWNIGIFAKYTRLWAAVTLVTTSVIGLALILAGYIVQLTPAVVDTMRAIGQSVVASVIVYVLLSLFVDPIRHRLQSQQTAAYAIEAANDQFQRRFETALPVAIFESSNIPKPAFRDAFVELLGGSTRYDVKGSAAEFSTFRVAVGSRYREFRRLEQVRFCLLDPLATELLAAQTQVGLREAHEPVTATAVEEGADNLRTKIYVSLVSLFDVRDAIRTTVYFHRDLPLFRCEMFDNGMFLTYYLDGVEYSESLQFMKNALPYRAYHAAMELDRQFATKVISFGVKDPSSDLIHSDEQLAGALKNLGCKLDLAALRLLRDQRFAELKQDLRAGGIPESQLF